MKLYFEGLDEKLSVDDIYDVIYSNLKEMMHVLPRIETSKNFIEFRLDDYFAKNVLSSTIKRWLKEEGIDVSLVRINREKHLTSWSGKTDGYDYRITIDR